MRSMDLNVAIKRMVETGKIECGTNKTLDNLKNGKAKLVITAFNCPKHVKEDILHYSKISETPLLEYDKSSMDLGKTCGKPFLISNLAVLNPGDISIADLVREKTKKTKSGKK